MICKKCERQVVMHAFSFGSCQECDTEISTSHIPCNKVCNKCSIDKIYVKVVG